MYFNVDFCIVDIQPNLSGSNTFGTMKICSRQGLLELMSVNYRGQVRRHNRDIFFSIFFNMKVCCVFSLK